MKWCYVCGQSARLCLNGSWWCETHAARFRPMRMKTLAAILPKVSRRPSLLRKAAA
jgi:hypothetical protein